MARRIVILFFALLMAASGDSVSTSVLNWVNVVVFSDADQDGALQNEGTRQNANVAWASAASENADSTPILSLEYPEIDFPAWVKPGVQVDTTLRIENTGIDTLTYTITKFETTGTAGWLGFTGFTSPVDSGFTNSVTGTINLNVGGVSNPTFKAVLTGGLVFTSNAPSSPDTFTIRLTIADTVVAPSLDTLFIRQNGTAKQELVVSSNGNFGNQGQGRVNLDFVTNGECDTTNETYLYDGSAVIGWVADGDTNMNWTIFGDSWLEDSTALRPYTGLPDSVKWRPRFRDCPNFEYYRTARFVTRDTSISMEKMWYAPKITTVTNDTLFIIQCLKVWLTSVGTPRSGVTIGEVIDWNIPSDSGADNSSATSLNQEIWQRGVDYAGDTVSCQPDSTRFGGMRYLYRYTNATKNDSAAFSAYTAENDSFVVPNNGFVAEELYKNFGTPGFAASDSVEDLHMGMCFRHNFSLTNTDTLRFYTILATVRNGNQAALQARFAQGKAWFNARNIANIPRDSCPVICRSCCVGVRGNVNLVGGVTVADLTYLVQFLFNSGPMICPEESNVNGIGGITVADLVYLVQFLFNGGPQPPLCPC